MAGGVRHDGSIQSANLPSHSSMAKNRVDRDFGIYRCMITKTNFVDDEDNTTFENLQVTYEAVILGGPKEGSILQNVKSAGDYGGEFNYAEKIWRPIDTKNLDEKPLSEHKGDIVYIGFLQGNTRAPVIIGGGIQPNDIDKTGATRDDGYRVRKEYNGIFEEIDNEGNYTLRRKGGDLDEESGIFTPDDEGDLASFELTEEQVIHKVGENISSVMDGETQTLTITFKGGMVITCDGENDSIQIKTSAGGEINIVEDKIAIGNETAELLQQISDQLDKLIQFANNVDATHDHIGNLGYPSSPPETAAQFVQLGTDLQEIKGKVDGIKGDL